MICEGDTKKLDDEIPLMTMFNEKHAKKENSQSNSYEHDFHNHWKNKYKENYYVPAGLALAEARKERPPAFLWLLGVQHLASSADQLQR